MTVHCAYKYALDPNDAAETALYGHCGAARFAYNHMLAQVKAVMNQRQAEASYGIAEADLTPTVNWSAYGLRKVWNQRKHSVAVDRDTGVPWWNDYSKEAASSALASLATGLENWGESKAGRRAGPKMGFPRFKRRKGDRVGSVRFTTGTIGLDGRTHVVLPVIGRVKTHESTRKLARRIEAGTAGSWPRRSNASVDAGLSLSERMFACECCGLSLDRDLNAARNLADQVAILFPEWPGEVKRGHGGDVRPAQRAVSGEASTPRPHIAAQGLPGGNVRITDDH